MAAETMEFLILGPLEVRRGRDAISLGGAKPRALLALLILHANEPVSAERLAMALWGQDEPAAAVKRVHVHVSRLRKALGDPDVLATTPAGYRLRVGRGESDAERFQQLVEDGQRALPGSPAQAAAALREALALWRGPALADLRYEPFSQAEILRLEEQRIAALEARIEADLAAGRHAALVGELRPLVAAHPTRERLAAHLMLALYRCGRQADALAVYRDVRRWLADELGLEPGDELRRLESRILARDPELGAAAPPAAAPPAAETRPRQAERRLVSVVRAALAAPLESMDPEAQHELVDRWSDACGSVLERHEGAVERAPGETMIGVYGLAGTREDDALRAVRAALELRDARVGVATGEAFVGVSARGATFAAGGPVTAAGRLEQAAARGDVLLDDTTRRRVENAVAIEALDGAWRVLGPLGEQRTPPPTPFVGREAERERLRAAFRDTVASASCRLVTILGPPGIGKSRLARELFDELGGDATVLVGRCDAARDDATYRPLAEIVRQVTPGRVRELLDDVAARRVAGAIGTADEPARAEEMFWAFRRLFAALAATRPLAIGLEDLHWGTPTLLEFLDYVMAFSSGSPILLVCVARPELLEGCPSWAAPHPQRALIELDALPPADSRRLVESLRPNLPVGEIVAAAEGNPLFLEQLTAMRAEDRAAALPPTVHAVVAARLDRLEPTQRAVLAHASVEGRTFHVGALAELLPEPDATASVVALVRARLIHADRPEFAGQDAFRFSHALIREAAYGSLPRRRRSELHARLAAWLARQPAAQDETMGYHLEQAYRHREALGDLGDREQRLADDAVARLARAARSARGRGDSAAAAQLLERAAGLASRDTPAQATLLVDLATARFEAGRLAEAEHASTAALAAAAGDARLVARAEIERQFVRIETGASSDEALRVAEAGLPVLVAHRDHRGQGRVWSLRAAIAWSQGHVEHADGAWQRAAACAERAGDERERFEILGWRASAAVFGPMPAPAAIRHCEELRRQAQGSPAAVAVTLHPLAALHAMDGGFDAARRLLHDANAILGELGRLDSAVSHHEALVELLAGRPETAEARLREGYRRLEAMGDAALLATTAAMLAQALHAQGALEEAERFCEVSAQTAPADDLVTQVIWRGVRAKLLAARDKGPRAEALARQAVRLAAATDLLTHHGDALLDLAEVMRLLGHDAAAHEAACAALALYERKANAVAAQRARAWLTAITTPGGRG